MTASEVLNFAQSAPVRARFDFTDDDLEDITRWVRQANIRWGFDQEHRKPYGVDFVHNTWRFGIDRVLTGVAMSDDAHAWIDSTLPSTTSAATASNSPVASPSSSTASGAPSTRSTPRNRSARGWPRCRTASAC